MSIVRPAASESLLLQRARDQAWAAPATPVLQPSLADSQDEGAISATQGEVPRQLTSLRGGLRSSDAQSTSNKIFHNMLVSLTIFMETFASNNVPPVPMLLYHFEASRGLCNIDTVDVGPGAQFRQSLPLRHLQVKRRKRREQRKENPMP